MKGTEAFRMCAENWIAISIEFDLCVCCASMIQWGTLVRWRMATLRVSTDLFSPFNWYCHHFFHVWVGFMHSNARLQQPIYLSSLFNCCMFPVCQFCPDTPTQTRHWPSIYESIQKWSIKWISSIKSTIAFYILFTTCACCILSALCEVWALAMFCLYRLRIVAKWFLCNFVAAGHFRLFTIWIQSSIPRSHALKSQLKYWCHVESVFINSGMRYECDMDQWMAISEFQPFVAAKWQWQLVLRSI